MHSNRRFQLWLVAMLTTIARTSAQAEQPYQLTWVHQLASAGEDVGRGVSADGLGNVYFSGWSFGSLKVANPTGIQTPFLARFDAAGNMAWLRQEAPIAGLPREATRIAADALGNIFVPFGGSQNVRSLNGFDAASNLKWTTAMPPGENLIGVATDGLGFAYMPTYVDDVIHLRKFDALTGSILWTQTLPIGSTTATANVAVDHLGHVYVSGFTSGDVIGPTAGGVDAWTAKFTDAGALVWARQFGSPADDLARPVAADAVGNVLQAGTTRGSLDAANAGGSDVFLSKHDPAGNLLWIRQLGTSTDESLSAMWADGAGNAYLAANSAGALGGPQLGDTDIVVAKYSPAGDLLWTKQIGTSGSENCTSVAGDAQGNIYIAGRTSGDWGATNAGLADAVLIKLSPVPEPSACVLAGLAIIGLMRRRREVTRHSTS